MQRLPYVKAASRGPQHRGGMNWGAYCRERAEQCDEFADATDDPVLEAMFRQMSEEWRAAANLPDDPPIGS
jgi:hypothetical protein